MLLAMFFFNYRCNTDHPNPGTARAFPLRLKPSSKDRPKLDVREPVLAGEYGVSLGTHGASAFLIEPIRFHCAESQPDSNLSLPAILKPTETRGLSLPPANARRLPERRHRAVVSS